jgi:hypothetical protein
LPVLGLPLALTLCFVPLVSLPSAAYPSACSAKAQTHSQAQTQVQAQTHRFPKYFLKRVSVSLFLLCIGFKFKKKKKKKLEFL